MIKAIIFDADGPLYYRLAAVTEQKAALLHKFGCNRPIDEFEELFHTEKFQVFDGRESAQHMFQRILSTLDCQLSDKEAERFAQEFDDIQSQVTATSEAVATLRTLKQQDYKICVLTDSFYSADEKRRWFTKIGINDFLDHVVSSHDIRRLKDTPEAYQACLDALQVSADQAIFVGHQPYEMVGAKKAGIKSVAILPISPSQIKADHKIQSLAELPTLLAKSLPNAGVFHRTG